MRIGDGIDDLSERGYLVGLNVDEEHAGARSGRRSSISAARLRSSRATMVSTVSPAPSATITPCPGARAVQVGERDAHGRAAPPSDQPDATQDQEREADQQDGRGQRDPDEDRAEAAIGDAGHRERAECRETSPSPARAAAGGSHRGGTSSARNMPAADTAARASGQMANRSAVSSPQAAAVSSGAGRTTVSRIGDSRADHRGSNQGTRCPTASPAAMPIPASARPGADTCGRSADCAPRGI